MGANKRATYEVSKAMLDRFVEWSKSDAFRHGGVYQKADAIVKWMRQEGFAGGRPLFALLRELHEATKPGTNDGDASWRWWLVERVTECIERKYEREYEVAEAARTLLRSMADEVDDLVKGGE
jgi:hypothetical protein